MRSSQQHGAFAFRFTEQHVNEVAQIWSVGWDEQTNPIYSWSGTQRKDVGKCIFQYTLSGQGEIELDGIRHRVQPGQAFIVKSHSNYRYYLPKGSEKWEFIFLTLYGNEVEQCWEYVKQTTNQVIRFHPDSTPIQLIKKMYDKAQNKNITNAYQGSSLAYQFTMELYHSISSMDKLMEEWPESVISAVLVATNYYQTEVGPEQMAEASGLSRYHFTRLFKKTTTLTPIQYLTKIRVIKASELLLHTKYSVDEIAELVGYKNANYLNKVFRKLTGMSPGQVRKRGKEISNKDILS
ncbi:AraC family transcriptional regulator [Metabacillus herbersteinensis]|uniref:AraC family transcriptional regulator n=1 Tax=Metabacillus herbersteinensis TaxID=283816 RepID=A0ABV6GFP1_9BACI